MQLKHFAIYICIGLLAACSSNDEGTGNNANSSNADVDAGSTNGNSANNTTGLSDECSTDTECEQTSIFAQAHDPDNFHCTEYPETGFNVCAECFEDSDCPQHFICENVQKYICRLDLGSIDLSCEMDTDCQELIDIGYFSRPEGVTCTDIDGVNLCAQCQTDEDCGEGEICGQPDGLPGYHYVCVEFGQHEPNTGDMDMGTDAGQ